MRRTVKDELLTMFCPQCTGRVYFKSGEPYKTCPHCNYVFTAENLVNAVSVAQVNTNNEDDEEEE